MGVDGRTSRRRRWPRVVAAAAAGTASVAAAPDAGAPESAAASPQAAGYPQVCYLTSFTPYKYTGVNGQRIGFASAIEDCYPFPYFATAIVASRGQVHYGGWINTDAYEDTYCEVDTECWAIATHPCVDGYYWRTYSQGVVEFANGDIDSAYKYSNANGWSKC